MGSMKEMNKEEYDKVQELIEAYESYAASLIRQRNYLLLALVGLSVLAISLG